MLGSNEFMEKSIFLTCYFHIISFLQNAILNAKEEKQTLNRSHYVGLLEK